MKELGRAAPTRREEGEYRGYSAAERYSEHAYLSGDIMDNSGYLNAAVSPERLDVSYIRMYLPHDETDGRRHGEVDYTYPVE